MSLFPILPVQELIQNMLCFNQYNMPIRAQVTSHTSVGMLWTMGLHISFSPWLKFIIALFNNYLLLFLFSYIIPLTHGSPNTTFVIISIFSAKFWTFLHFQLTDNWAGSGARGLSDPTTNRGPPGVYAHKKDPILKDPVIHMRVLWTMKIPRQPSLCTVKCHSFQLLKLD